MEWVEAPMNVHLFFFFEGTMNVQLCFSSKNVCIVVAQILELIW